MTTPCLYAIIRFCPFIETEEFANVGVIMMAPEYGYFTYKLMTRRHARVTHFFEQLESNVFKAAMNNLAEELDRTHKMLKNRGFGQSRIKYDADFDKNIFTEIIRSRETVIKFSQMRGILASDPKRKIIDLYNHYVERDFVTKEYRETILEKNIRKWIISAGIASRFEKADVGNDEYHATFPFVEQKGAEFLKAVKPLSLVQEQPSKILDHGGQWLFRVQTLKRKNLLPKNILFAVEGPNESGPRSNAYQDIVGALEDFGATVLPYNQKNMIMNFLENVH